MHDAWMTKITKSRARVAPWALPRPKQMRAALLRSTLFDRPSGRAWLGCYMRAGYQCYHKAWRCERVFKLVN